MRFSDITPIYDFKELESAGTAEYKVPIVAEIVVPVNLVPSMIKALQQKYNEYQDTYKKDQLEALDMLKEDVH